MAVLSNLISSLVLKNFWSTPLLVFLVSFWTETLRLSLLEETDYVVIIQYLYHQSHSMHFLKMEATLKMAFHALIHRKLDYVAPAWQPWLSATNLFCLDRLKNRSLCLITDQLVSSQIEVLRLEDDVQSYHTRHCTALMTTRNVLL